METLSPLVNLLLLFTVLSVAAERVTNVWKLRRPHVRLESADPEAEKRRESKIAQANLVACIGLALLVKADFFQILGRLDAPWETLGWAQMRTGELVQSSAMHSVPEFLYALAGSALTGFALSFGSKFWHDVLDIVFNARQQLKQLTRR